MKALLHHLRLLIQYRWCWREHIAVVGQDTYRITYQGNRKWEHKDGTLSSDDIEMIGDRSLFGY